MLKETAFRYEETGVIVQALKAIGADGLTPATLAAIRQWLPSAKCSKVLKDSERITDWAYAAMKQICQEGSNG